jgi:hypothetical protein
VEETVRTEIRAAGDYLLSILRTDRAVWKSRFYNADPRTLADAIWPYWTSLPVEDRGELNDDAKRRFIEEGHLFVEWAAMQLEDLGVVKNTVREGYWLDDGEVEFLIELTERGQRFVEDGEIFGYRDIFTEYYVSKVSGWILDCLEAEGPDQTLTLRDLMDRVYTPGDPMVMDDCGNEYPRGTNTYAWAFEVCLWHHARSMYIEPVFADEAQRQAWEEHLRHQGRPPRPNLNSPRLLWDVPFRLGEAVDPYEEVQHVGTINEE